MRLWLRFVAAMSGCKAVLAISLLRQETRSCLYQESALSESESLNGKSLYWSMISIPTARLDRQKSTWVLAGFASVVLLALCDVLPLLKGLCVFLLLCVLSGVVQLSELRRRFPVDIIVIVGSALSLAQLMLTTGLSSSLGTLFISAFNGYGVFGALVATYLFTVILTELVTNNAAAAPPFRLVIAWR